MRVLLLHNPIAGAGRSARVSESLCGAVASAGHEVRQAHTVRSPEPGWLMDELDEAELLVVIGGDGAVRLASEPAARSGTPIYQFPLGTENLFAREFGMSDHPAGLLRALDRFELRQVDMGCANGEPFVLMASVGYDATVAHDVQRSRGSRISHRTYVPAMIRGLRTWEAADISVEVDGKSWDTWGATWVVVANCRQYGFRLNPAPRANMTDGLLDVVAVDLRGWQSIVKRLVTYRMGRQETDQRAVRTRGRSVVIRSKPAQPWQLDGDQPLGEPVSKSVSISLADRRLGVLVP